VECGKRKSEGDLKLPGKTLLSKRIYKRAKKAGNVESEDRFGWDSDSIFRPTY